VPDQAWERRWRCPPNRRRFLPSISRLCCATLRVTAAVADRRDRGCGRLSTRPPRRGRSSAPPPDGSLTVGVVGSKLGLAVSVSGQARAQERRRKSPPTRRRFFPPVVLRPPGCFGCCAWRRGKTPQINTVTVSGFLREEWGRFNHSGRPPLTDTTARPRAPQPRPRNLGYR
jgi:hypothetical protein